MMAFKRKNEAVALDLEKVYTKHMGRPSERQGKASRSWLDVACQRTWEKLQWGVWDGIESNFKIYSYFSDQLIYINISPWFIKRSSSPFQYGPNPEVPFIYIQHVTIAWEQRKSLMTQKWKHMLRKEGLGVVFCFSFFACLDGST